MANPYTITYKFGSALDVGELLAGNNALRLSMEFIIDDDGTDSVKWSQDYGLHIIDWGELNWSREVDENLLTSGRYTFAVRDGGYDDSGTIRYEFHELFYSGTIAGYARKNAKVTLEISYNGAAYVTEYIGYLEPVNIEYNITNRIMNFIVYPQSDILKSIYLYKDDPDNNGRKIGLNPINIGYWVGGDEYHADATKVSDVLHNIFKQINSSISLTLTSDWAFIGYNGVSTHNFAIADLWLYSNFLSALFFSTNNPYGIDSLDQLLKEFAFAFGSITGVIHNEKAFFVNMNYYNAGNLQTLGNVMSHKINLKYGNLDKTKITSTLFKRHKVNKNEYEQDYKPQFGLAPTTTEGNIEAKTYQDKYNYWQSMPKSNMLDERCLIYGSDINTIKGADAYGIYSLAAWDIRTAYAMNMTVQTAYYGFLAYFYYLLRNKKRMPAGYEVYGRVDALKVEGVNYDYLKNFDYGGGGYQILGLTKKFAKNTSEIDALKVVTNVPAVTPGTGEDYSLRYANVLPGGYMRDYAYNSEINVADINTDGATLYTVPAGYELKKIILKINTKFDTLLTMDIYDSDGILIASERINNENNEVVESYQYKNYATSKTISVITTKSGTCAAGDADIIFEVRTRQ